MKPHSADEYEFQLQGELKDIVAALRGMVKHLLPDAKESIKWNIPCYDLEGLICYINARKKHVELGLMRGKELKDEGGILEGLDKKLTRHISFNSLDDLEAKEDAVAEILLDAKQLNLKVPKPRR